MTSGIEIAAPSTYAAEIRFHEGLVAKKKALMICGPAIITKASGRTLRMSTGGTLSQGSGGRELLLP